MPLKIRALTRGESNEALSLSSYRSAWVSVSAVGDRLFQNQLRPLSRFEPLSRANEWTDFRTGDTVYLDLGPFPDQVKQQIKNALAKWDFANTNSNNSGVRFNTTVDPWTLPGHPSLIHVAHKVFFNEDGSVDHQSAAEMVTVRTDGVYFTRSDNLF